MKLGHFNFISAVPEFMDRGSSIGLISLSNPNTSGASNVHDLQFWNWDWNQIRDPSPRKLMQTEMIINF